MPNFVKIAQTAAEKWLIVDFSRWRPPPSWIFKILSEQCEGKRDAVYIRRVETVFCL